VRLVSVNVATPQNVVLGGRARRTAILKRPQEGPVEVGPLGLARDQVASTKHHGGPDQAVYLYGTDDYAWWVEELGTPLAPGTFGENLTVEGLRTEGLRIGDQLEVGPDVVLELTSPRIPCETFAGRMDDPAFVKRFVAARRTGAYARVLAGGSIRVGDAVGLVPTDGDVELLELLAAYLDRHTPAAVLERLLAAPVAIRAREDLKTRLDRLRLRAAG
jgi:MOSC domain-containing protein YiiM